MLCLLNTELSAPRWRLHSSPASTSGRRSWAGSAGTANLTGATFLQCSLKGFRFDQARMEGVDIRGQLEGAKLDGDS